MIYPFRCPDCGKYTEAIRPMSAYNEPEICKCGQQMARVYTVPHVSVPDMQPHFNYGLGREVHSKHDIRDAVREISDGKVKGRTVWHRDPDTRKLYSERVDVPGREIVEVGNERVKPVPAKRHDYTMPKEVLDKVWKDN